MQKRWKGDQLRAISGDDNFFWTKVYGGRQLSVQIQGISLKLQLSGLGVNGLWYLRIKEESYIQGLKKRLKMLKYQK